MNLFHFLSLPLMPR